MKRGLVLVFVFLVIVCPSVFAQQARSTASTTSPEISEVIRRFAAAESANKIARNNYTFTQDFDFRTIGEAGSITGRFKRVSDIVYDDLGNRIEKITYNPPSTITALDITQQDMQDLAGVQPFALTTEDLPKYIVTYVGKEKIDELSTYIFEVKPKEIRKGERYLEGRIWVDDQDMQIVKVAGKGVPEDEKNKYPHFESYRENVGGRYWFPTYVYSDDVLAFKHDDVHIKMTVRYTNYKRFGGRIKMADEGDVANEADVKGADQTKQNQNKPPAPAQEPAPKTKKP